MDPPIVGQLFDTFDDLFAAVQNHARQTGWAVVKTRASNRRANGNYYKYDLACDRGINRHKEKPKGGVVGGVRGLVMVGLLISANEIVLPDLTAKRRDVERTPEMSVSCQEKTIGNFFFF